jgi:hypothetical protein
VFATGNIALTEGEMFIGGNGNGRHYFSGDVAEVIMFNRVLDQAQLHRLGAYLKNRYGIAAANYDRPRPQNDSFLPGRIPGCILGLRAESPKMLWYVTGCLKTKKLWQRGFNCVTLNSS